VTRVPWLPVLYGVIVAGISAAILTTPDPGPEELRAMIRATAFTSSVAFLPAFAASALRRLRPAPLTQWLVANRRYLGLSVAASHFWHLIAIVAFVRLYSGDNPVPRVTVVFGGAGFVFLALMAATSNDASQRALGRAWGWLHRVGLYVVWLDFIFTYMGTATVSAFHAVMTLAFAAAWMLRIVAFAATPRA
jgi:DMSO/TMAO reductase YedYZ heme-binding membrane subunit